MKKAKKSPIPGHKKGKTIIPKLPADARRNLAKLERGRGISPTKKGLRGKTLIKEDEETDQDLTKKERVLTIFRSEGIDAACCGIVKTSKALRWITKEVEQDERRIKKASKAR